MNCNAENPNLKLRSKAEEILQSSIDNLPLTPESAHLRELLHELHVHQIELEIQNEELRRTQSELEAVHKRFADLYNNAPVGYVVLDKNGIIVLINMTFAKMIGKPHEDIAGKPFADFIADSDKLIFRARFKTFFNNPDNKKIELKMTNAAGNVFYSCLEAASFIFKKDSVSTVGDNELLLTISNITERVQAEKIIEKEREQLAVTLKCIRDGVITTDINGNVVLINDAAEQMTGWTQKDAAGRHLSSVLVTVNETTHIPEVFPILNVLQTGEYKAGSDMRRLISRVMKERIITINCAPMRDVNHVIHGAVLVFRDITEQQKMMEHMQKTEKLDSLGLLAGGIAHDFNNLLCGIFGYINLARVSCDDNCTEVIDALEKASTVYGRAKDLTQRLLTFSKGGIPALKTRDITQFIKKNASFMLSGSNIDCVYDISDGIWMCDYDENQIGQVFDNLVLNAQQAMSDGGKVSFTIRNCTIEGERSVSLPEGRYVSISITDQGSGIPPEIIGKIFDPFFTTKQKGTGLGLTTCYSIIRKHGGHIDVESSPGQGTTFIIYLPASDNDASEELEASQFKIQGTGSILIMDDEAYMRDVAGGMLRKPGFNIIEASNGEEALTLCERALSDGIQIQAALFDLTIPGGMSGATAVIEMKKKFPHIPVFAASGYSQDPIISDPRSFGFTDSIAKPFRREQLYKMLLKAGCASVLL